MRKKKAQSGLNIDSTLNANRKVPFVDRIINADKYPTIKLPDQPYPSTHLMMQVDNYAVPQLRYIDGKWINNTNPDDAINAGDAIKFKNEADALYFTEHYKDSKLSKLNTMAKKKKAQLGSKFYPGTQLDSWEKSMQPEKNRIPDPMEELKRIQNMKVAAPTLQDYGVQGVDPQSDLTAGLGVYSRKPKRKPVDWSNVLAGGLLAVDALIPGEPIKRPVVRPQLGYNPHQYGTGSQAIAKSGKKISNTGYKRNSKDKNAPSLRIPSNQITMKDVDFPVIGISDTGDTQYMVPGEDYTYDGSYVDEFPQAKDGKWIQKAVNPKHKGYCTPMTKKTCTPRRKALARTFKKHHGFHEDGGIIEEFGKGGKLSIAKAKEMLRDGKANGKKLTARQKRYFGFIAGGGEAQNGAALQNPLGNVPKIGTAQEREKATLEAQRLGYKHGLMDPSNMQIGKYIPQFVDEAGRPYKGAPAKQLAPIPDYINPEDLITEQGVTYYLNKEGDPVDVPLEQLNTLPRFKKPKQQVLADILSRSTPTTVALKYGGAIKYNDGGNVSPISSRTAKINGPSHEDGGVPFMGIEAEGGETAYKALDGSVNIMGNMINPITGRKFKADSITLAKKEAQMDKLMDYSMGLINDADIKDKYDILKLNSGRIQFQGAAKKKGEINSSQEHLANIQNAMLEYSDEMGIDPGSFSRGYIQKAWKGARIAQDGKKLSLAQRHNNPGNLKFAKWMRKYGAVPGEAGTDGGNFAKFPSVEQGQQAMVALLKDKKYAGKTVEDAIKTWTNNQSYKNIPADLKGKKIDSLDPTQFTNLLNTITTGEDSKLYNWEGIEKAPPPVRDERRTNEALKVPGSRYNPNAPRFPGEAPADRVGRSDYDLTVKNPVNYDAPSDARGLSIPQILPELYAAATNKVEPVYMQEFTPQLYQDYEVSFQDQLNENQASFSALSKAVGNDPSTLSVLAAQKYGADSGVLANEFRTNQAIEQDIVNKNISLLNDAELKNLGLADVQFTRQSTAKSKTKAQNQLILNSIADKVTQNEYEQRLQRTYENLYPNYRFGEDYKTDYYGPTAGEAINIPGPTGALSPLNAGDPQVTVRTDAKGNVSTSKKYPSNIQKQLQDVQLSTNKLKYQDYFINRERSAAKKYRNFQSY